MPPHPLQDSGLSEQAAARSAETLSDTASGRTTMWLPSTQNGDLATGPGGLTLGRRPYDSLMRETGQLVSATHPPPRGQAHPAPAHVGLHGRSGPEATEITALCRHEWKEGKRGTGAWAGGAH